RPHRRHRARRRGRADRHRLDPWRGDPRGCRRRQPRAAASRQGRGRPHLPRRCAAAGGAAAARRRGARLPLGAVMKRTASLLCALLLWCWVLPAWAQEQFRVLVVAIPNQYHHDYAVVARPQFERMAQRHGFDMDWRWNTAPFDGDLSPYHAIVLLNTP